MKNSLYPIISFFFIILLCFSLYILNFNYQYFLQENIDNTNTKKLDESGENFKILIINFHGNLSHYLSGTFFKHELMNDIYHIKNPIIINTKMNEWLMITSACDGIIEENWKKIILKNDVQIFRKKSQDDNPVKIQGEEFHIYPEKDMVYTDMRVNIFKENLKISGKGMTFDGQKNQFRILNSSQAEIQKNNKSYKIYKANTGS
ncbi:MAG: LPS export ABC transporter periplasmic protein LptC [Bordetella sp.]|nr:MAG: LPS export ABC transporter periplasmic protein LptC [Bordetella sp.]